MADDGFRGTLIVIGLLFGLFALAVISAQILFPDVPRGPLLMIGMLVAAVLAVVGYVRSR